MKKSISILLSLIMIMSVFSAAPIAAFADTDGDFTYSVSTGQATITGYNGNAEELVIPATLGGKNVVAIGDSVFDANTTLKKVIISEGITKIGDSAFYDCENIERVDIPFSVTTIAGWAFKGCSSLKTAFIRGPVSVISEGAFRGCTSLSAISLPTALVSIKDDAFTDCEKLEFIYYADSVNSFNDDIEIAETNICLYGAKFNEYSFAGNCGDNAYYVFNDTTKALTIKGTGSTDNYFFGNPGFYGYKDDVKTAFVEEGITCIDDGIFYNLVNMTYVSLPESLTEIGEAAFSQCASLKGIDIPRNVKRIQNMAFADCVDLTKVNVYSYSVNIEAKFSALTTIYACKGSTAEAYAEKNNYNFISIGHNWGEWNIIDDEIEPTCATYGKTALRYHECVLCGSSETDGGYAIELCDHIFGQGVITKYPTPTETGLIEFVCEECGKKETKTVAKCEKYTNTLSAKAKKPTVKYSKLKKKTQYITRKEAITVSNAKGTVNYTKSSGNKKITVDKKTGKITVKKGLKKGTYKVKVKVKAAGTSAYKSKTVTVTVTIKVK